jgi:hypothetical protein
MMAAPLRRICCLRRNAERVALFAAFAAPRNALPQRVPWMRARLSAGYSHVRAWVQRLGPSKPDSNPTLHKLLQTCGSRSLIFDHPSSLARTGRPVWWASHLPYSNAAGALLRGR